MPYTKLFEPGRIGSLELRNRIVMPAMGCSLAEVTGEPGPRMIKYYADRARGGAGMIILLYALKRPIPLRTSV